MKTRDGRRFIAQAGCALALSSGCDQPSPPALEATTAPTAAPAPPPAAPPPRACRRGSHPDLVYRSEGAQPVHRLDLHVPESGDDLPVVIYVHGGAWREGDRSRVFHKPAFFTAEGFVFASVGYRLSTPESGVTHPMHVEDVASAIAHLEENVRDYCGDRRRMVAMGHSAGGQIVATVASDARHLSRAGAAPQAIRCAVVNDTEGFDLPRLFERRKSGWLREVYENAFGTRESVLRDASPITHVEAHPALPAFFLVTRGSEERRGQVAAFADKVRSAGGIAFIHDAKDRDHVEIDRDLGAPGDDLGPETVRFYRRCLGIDPPFSRGGRPR